MGTIHGTSVAKCSEEQVVALARQESLIINYPPPGKRCTFLFWRKAYSLKGPGQAQCRKLPENYLGQLGQLLLNLFLLELVIKVRTLKDDLVLLGLQIRVLCPCERGVLLLARKLLDFDSAFCLFVSLM